MAILVDTNVLSDVIHGDATWEPWALEKLSRYAGEIVINPIIFAELCCRVTSVSQLEEILEPFQLGYQELPKPAWFIAAQAFLIYRERGGVKTSALPDFFIGAHAAALGVPILTREVNRYRTYFSTVPLICP